MTQGMKLVGVSIVVFLTAAASLALLNFSLPPHLDLLGFLSNRVFLFTMFNTITFAIFAKSFKPSMDEFAEPFLHFGYYEEEEAQSKDRPNDDDSSYHRSNCDYDDYDDDDNAYYYGSDDGYDEDDDDDGSDDEIGWDSNEEHDDLESRIDEFITKVITGWREELLRDNLYNNYKVQP
ncbi:uncharacterized protein LOC132281531 [Cornus florida]|uniref:uncharacterized protein LOC132281531 n=1 Tax=Cornus florida TaxID=4283 RepID=UPI00289DBF0E|nr:uncharacterized protein LOC132281531 [Cornus florida]